MALRFDKNTSFCMSISARPSNFGIRFHNFLYEELGLNFLYKSFAASSTEAFDDGIRAMKSLGIRGCGISMPFKEHALRWADEKAPAALKIGAINTLVLEQDRLVSWNTDSIAVQSLLEKIASDPNIDRRSSRVAVLGSGGMSRAILWALRESGFENVQLVSRNAESGTRLSQDFGVDWKSIDANSLEQSPAEVLINATPIGMNSTEIPFADEQIRKAQWIIDSVASPPETELIRKARTLGKKVITGFEITVLQAVEQFVLYTGARPQADQVRRAASHSAGF
jgi:shikimate dehydrogenase